MTSVLRIVLQLALVVWVITAGPKAAQAQPLLELFGPPSATNPLTARAWSNGPAAAYFNPSLLANEQTGKVVVSFLYVGQLLQIGLAPRPGTADISTDIYDARVRLADGGNARLDYRPLPTEALRNGRGAMDPGTSGVYLELGGNLVLIPSRLVLGIHALLPAGSAMEQA